MADDTVRVTQAGAEVEWEDEAPPQRIEGAHLTSAGATVEYDPGVHTLAVTQAGSEVEWADGVPGQRIEGAHTTSVGVVCEYAVPPAESRATAAGIEVEYDVPTITPRVTSAGVLVESADVPPEHTPQGIHATGLGVIIEYADRRTLAATGRMWHIWVDEQEGGRRTIVRNVV